MMKKHYVTPCVEVLTLASTPLMINGSIESMQYGESNVFGDDDESQSAKEDFGCDFEDF